MNWRNLFFDRRNAPATPPDLYREMRLGNEAQSLLDSPAYQRAVERMRVNIHEQWAASPVADHEGQHELRLMLKLLDAMEQHIRTEADTAKLAKQQIDQKRKAA